MYNLSNFVERLDTLMFDKRITAIKLSNDIGIASATVTRYLQGKFSPSVETLMKIADYFNCSCDYLLGRTDDDSTATFYPCPPFTEQLKVLKEHFKCPWMYFYTSTNITASRFYDWKNGKSVPSVDCVIMLADGFNCSVDFILGRTKD